MKKILLLFLAIALSTNGYLLSMNDSGRSEVSSMMLLPLLAYLLSYKHEPIAKNRFRATLNTLEEALSLGKELPQYKYLARPVYKYAGGVKRPFFATLVSFGTTDMIMHWLLPGTIIIARRLIIDQNEREKFIADPIAYVKNNFPQLNKYSSFCWMMLGMTIALHKHTKLKTLTD